MRKNINKKIFPAVVLACCITLVWVCAAMAEHTRITNRTDYTASGEVKYKSTPLCKPKEDYSYTAEKGRTNDRNRPSKCEVSKITAKLHDGGKTKPCKAFEKTCKQQNFRIQGDMNQCEVVAE